MNLNIPDWVHNTISPQIQEKLLYSFVVILVLQLIRWLILRLVDRRIKNTVTLYQARKTIGYTSVLLIFVTVAPIWFTGFGSLGTIIGLISAGLAIALQDLIGSFAGWMFILWRRPFQLGDRIEIGDKKGDVIDLRIFQFSLMEIGNWVNAEQSTGRVVHVPNGKVFRESVANYSRGFRYIWDELPIMVTFESDWKKAKIILQEVVQEHAEHLSKSAQKDLRKAARKYLIFFANLTPIVYTEMAASGVVLTMRYLCDPRQRRSVHSVMVEAILVRFAACDDIDFAYPTIRHYDNVDEGKTDARAVTERYKGVKD